MILTIDDDFINFYKHNSQIYAVSSWLHAHIWQYYIEIWVLVLDQSNNATKLS